jgi:pyrroloquinoline quinone (PQQ) biosynthesis protein C
MFPGRLNLSTTPDVGPQSPFHRAWFATMREDCRAHPVWSNPFVKALAREPLDRAEAFALASVWSINMVVGSYCFPRYVAALAGRAEQDCVRHGLLENAWDESGGHHHTSRSHFWLAVRLARLLSLSDRQIERVCPLPEAQAYTDEHYRQCSAGDFGFALGMICLIEEFTTPEFSLIFKAFLQSCSEGAGISPADFVLNGGAEYFTANIADDERHREEMPRIVAAWLAASGVDLNDAASVERGLGPVRAGARYSADLRRAFFDGIYRFVRGGRTYWDLVALEPR